METIYYYLGAIVFWTTCSITFLVILFLVGEKIYKKHYTESYITFLDFIVNRKQYKAWRTLKDKEAENKKGRIEELKKIGIKVSPRPRNMFNERLKP
jgi:hypothetical protein